MNATKLIAATVAAGSVLGVIGLAYAQSTSPAASPAASAPMQMPMPTPNMQQPMPPTPLAAPVDSTLPGNRAGMGTMNTPSTGSTTSRSTDTLNTPSSGTTGGTVSPSSRDTLPNSGSGMTNDGRGMPTERAARADRN